MAVGNNNQEALGRAHTSAQDCHALFSALYTNYNSNYNYNSKQRILERFMDVQDLDDAPNPGL